MKPWKKVIYRKNKPIGWIIRSELPRVNKMATQEYCFDCHLNGEKVPFCRTNVQGAAEKAVVEEYAKRVVEL